MPYPKIKYQHLQYTILIPEQVITIEAETDKLYNTCTGTNILVSDDSAKFSTIQLDINNLEVFPEHFEIVRLLFREHVPFGYDYHTLNEPAGGSKIKGTYIDKGGATYPYTLTISFRLENVESTDAGKL